MCILKISPIKASVTTIIEITDRNAGMQNKLPNNKNKDNDCKTIQDFSKFLLNTFKTVCFDVRC